MNDIIIPIIQRKSQYCHDKGTFCCCFICHWNMASFDIDLRMVF